ncbi:hypothetical protein J2Z69_002070 [Paenibacillus shirakamiensis]|uniref:Uncharacterized protein n=1 Tax=Paenibacillus shirakamiensis TaxID=1265935 RepID=A0ABS4JH35_9BACL|nr:hypothetical protein [Paenibacillus shirakamiensis]MBP2001027.1 hypothetical protein [Paenibacillus shirakamiensis]
MKSTAGYIPELVLFVTGSLIIVLSWLEKILLFNALHEQVAAIDQLLGRVPPYIWSLTNYTFWFGLVLIIIGLGFFLFRFLRTKSLRPTR